MTSKEWRDNKIRLGICTSCWAPAKKGLKQCEKCLDKYRKIVLKYQAYKIQNGKCKRCGKDKPADRQNRNLCKSCANKQVIRAREKFYERVAKGLCVWCGAKREDLSLKGCTLCTNDKVRREKVRGIRAKDIILDRYGRVCACCGESNIEFLTIDHIDGNGATHRKTDRSAKDLKRWLINAGLPDGFRTLCFNCNAAKSTGKQCPHLNAKVVQGSD